MNYKQKHGAYPNFLRITTKIKADCACLNELILRAFNTCTVESCDDNNYRFEASCEKSDSCIPGMQLQK